MTFFQSKRMLAPVVAAAVVMTAGVAHARANDPVPGPSAAAAASSPVVAAQSSPVVAAQALSATAAAKPRRVTTRRFSLVVPRGWRELRRPAPPARGLRSEVLLARPKVKGYRTNVYVLSQKAPAKLTLWKMAASTVSQARKAGFDIISKPAGSRFRGGSTAVDYAWTYRSGKRDILQGQMLVKNRGRVYVITLSTPVANIERDAKSFRSIISSWRWR